MDSDIHKVIILGSGPAGLTSAIYCARALLKPVVIEGTLSGGLLMLTTTVENFPGFPVGVNGPELMERMKQQAKNFGAIFINDMAIEVNFLSKPFVVKTSSKEYRAHAVIIATGASSKMLQIRGEKELLGYGVSTCATCDGPFFKEKVVAIVGGGDSAIEEALFISRFAKKILVLHRRDTLRASKIMQKKAFENKKIEFIWNTIVTEIGSVEDKKVKWIITKNIKTNETKKIEVEGVFVAIGHKPNTEIFKGQLEMDEVGYIKTFGGKTYTSCEGVFAAGDVVDKIYRQAITAAGSGCQAAIDAEKYLESQEFTN
ncbi:MAG: thioredoxin-disulfide reductase [Planctomycetota bacterium]